MSVTPWVCMTFFVFSALGCGSNTDSADTKGSAESSVTEPNAPGDQMANNGHLRVLVSYENGQFTVERVVEVDTPLRKPRSGKARPGLTYIANQSGKGPFMGSAPDPRRVHVEVPNAVTGELEHREAQPPGKQHFFVYVPKKTQTVDFHEHQPVNPDQLRAQGVAAAPASPLGSIDLRARR